VLAIHGAGGGFDQGLDIGRPAVESGFRVIAPSRFGYLRTPVPAEASAAAQADAHACLLDALEVPRAAVIGVSAGAPSAMQLALRHPERMAALVLVVPAAYVPRPGGGPSLATPPRTPAIFETALRFDFLFWAATRVTPETMQRSVLATPPDVVRVASADEQARVATILEHILPVSTRRLGLLNDAAVVARLERYELEEIAAPTLVISLEDDLYGTYEPARYTAEHVPGARFVGYPTGGHVWVGHHHDVISEITRFLREATR
jgi:pimeloyl-ACP methyl ester carboxylesterase